MGLQNIYIVCANIARLILLDRFEQILAARRTDKLLEKQFSSGKCGDHKPDDASVKEGPLSTDQGHYKHHRKSLDGGDGLCPAVDFYQADNKTKKKKPLNI